MIRIIQKRYPQTIIATHSVEIIAEVEPKNIITIDKRKRQMSYATDMKAVRKIVDNIGSINNLPHVSLGGFNNLQEAFGASKLFYEETRGSISCMCILDRDYLLWVL